MEESLDQVVETDPEYQPEVFSQRVEAPEPAPEPEPPRQVERPPEPEAPPVEPEWLSAPPPQPQQPQQQYYQEQPQYYQQPQPQQQRQQQRQPSGSLDRFIDDPDGYIDQLLQARLAEQTTPLAYQQYQMAQQVQQIRDTFTSSALSQADNALKGAYKHLNKDSAFRTSKSIQGRIENTLRGMREQAVMQARAGNFGPLNNLASLNESHIRAALAAAKAMEGIDSPGVGPLQVEGATVESSRSAPQQHSVDLDPDQKEAVRRLGPAYETRLRKALAEADKYDDFQG